MKRYIDMTHAGVEAKFAWFDTVVDEFERHSGTSTWSTFKEFAEDYVGDELERYKNLMPLEIIKMGGEIDEICPRCGGNETYRTLEEALDMCKDCGVIEGLDESV